MRQRDDRFKSGEQQGRGDNVQAVATLGASSGCNVTLPAATAVLGGLNYALRITHYALVGRLELCGRKIKRR